MYIISNKIDPGKHHQFSIFFMPFSMETTTWAWLPGRCPDWVATSASISKNNIISRDFNMIKTGWWLTDNGLVL